jgi:hypothetical protein
VTTKQTLRRHIEDMHRRPHGAISHMTLAELQRFHRGQHHRYATDHSHAGANLGPGQRPPGWSTGEDVVPS